ncbi:MAG TPA: MFS transporter [Candidatus Dormibacteraeota bacterium]
MPQKWRTMLGVSVGALSAPLASSTITIGLPTIGQGLHQDITVVEWVVVSYLLVTTSLLQTFGRLGDLISIKHLYAAGFGIFTIGALVSGLSHTLPLLLFGRVVQGIGGAMMFAISAAIVIRAFPASQRGLALGVNAVFTYAGLSLGPLIGALLLQAFSWQALFLFNIPLGVVGVAVALLFIQEDAPAGRRTRFDLWGATLGFLGLFAILLYLSRGPTLGWGSIPALALLTAGLALIALFIAVELRVPAPVLDLSLFKNHLFSASLTSSVLAYLAVSVLTLLVPFYLIQGLHYSYVQAALLLTPVSVAMMLLAPVSGRLSDAFGSRALTVGGMSLMVLSFVLLWRMGMHPSPLALVVPLVLNGAGMGLFTSPNNSAIMSGAPPQRSGTAAGALATSRNLGMALGIAMAAAVTAARVPAHLAEHLSVGQATVAAYEDAFLAAAVVALLAAGASLIRPSARAAAGSAPQVAAM